MLFRSNVTVSLVSVPPEGTALLGGYLFTAYRFTPGAVQDLTGARLTIAYSLTPGAAQTAPGAGDSAAYWADWPTLNQDLLLYE